MKHNVLLLHRGRIDFQTRSIIWNKDVAGFFYLSLPCGLFHKTFSSLFSGIWLSLFSQFMWKFTFKIYKSVNCRSVKLYGINPRSSCYRLWFLMKLVKEKQQQSHVQVTCEEHLNVPREITFSLSWLKNTGRVSGVWIVWSIHCVAFFYPSFCWCHKQI